MTEDQTTPESAADAPADTAMPESQAAPVTDPARQAEIDSLAAELQGKAPAKKPVRKSRRVTVQDPNEVAAEPAVADDAPAPAAAADAEPDAPAAPAKRTTRATAAKRPTKAAAAKKAAEEAAAAEESEGAAAAPTETPADAEPTSTESSSAPAEQDGAEQEGASSDGTDGESADGEQGEGSGRSRSRRGRSRSRSGGSNGDGQTQSNGADGEDGGRTRERGRKRSGGRLGDDAEPEILPDDVLLPIAGILDVLDNYAFVRTTGYLAGVTDVYVSLGQVKKYGLRKGDAVVGAIRQPRDGEQQGRQKYNALVKVDSVNGLTAEASIARTEFQALTPIRPVDALAGDTKKGQRAVVIGATGAGKTQHVSKLAAAVSAAQTDAHLMVILVAPRAEEVTEFRRAVKGEVVVSGLELSAEDHVTVVELAVERAKRLVELGIDVVVLIDSITQLGRAYATLAPGARGILDDPSIALPAKRLLGAARATEEGASLTIVATASAETPLDRLVATELAAIANATVQL